jgi:hypothetical protein
MGFYSATPANMEKFREHITRETKRFGKIIGSYKPGEHIIGGEEYKKRYPMNFPMNSRAGIKKGISMLTAPKKPGNSFFSPLLKDEISGFFHLNSDLYRFLIESIGLKDIK